MTNKNPHSETTRPKTWLHSLLDLHAADGRAVAKPQPHIDSCESATLVPDADASTSEKPTLQVDETVDKTLPKDTLGVALSGGGIRSASFCLGILQAMAASDWLKHVDILSTVSGGGYTGSLIGRFFDQQRRLDDGLEPGVSQQRAKDMLLDVDSPTVQWVRRHSNYLSPTGFGELMFNFAAFWRNILSLHVVLALFFLALFGTANAIAYWLLPSAGSAFQSWISPFVPLTNAEFGRPDSLWFILAELTVWLAAIPLALGYWLVSQDEHERLVLASLVGALLVAIGLLVAAAQPLALIVLVAAIVWVLLAWRTIRQRDGHGDPYAPYRLGLARNLLTYRLAFWTTSFVVLVALGAVDLVGRWLARLSLFSNQPIWEFKLQISLLASALFAGVPILRGIAGLVSRSNGSGGWSTLLRIPYVITSLTLLLTAGLPMVVIAWLSHWSFGDGYSLAVGLWITAGAWGLSWLFGRQSALPFVNRVGPLTIYAARLARVFLGAVNPIRIKSRRGSSVTNVIEGDDVEFKNYDPSGAGGPLHLVNVAVNETVDVASQRSIRDRQAENMAVGPVGINVSRGWHSMWRVDSRGRRTSDLVPLGNSNQPHPFRRRDGQPVTAESLSLRQWIAISGAAASPGMGRTTSPAVSLLTTLSNVRLGYWWNTGVWSSDLAQLPLRDGLFARVKNLFMWIFATQGLLVSELRGQFGGPWRRHAYLSDGGNFENCAAYELIRRRVPLIIVCDAGRDHRQQLGGLAELTRIARIDFGAEFTIVKPDDPQLADLPTELRDRLGSLDSLVTHPANVPERPAFSQHHATLVRIHYPSPPTEIAATEDAWHRRTCSWMLYLKATTVGDEPTDVRNYQAKNPLFPNESTLDQFFDEPQFESYRKLGVHIGEKFFAVTDGGEP